MAKTTWIRGYMASIAEEKGTIFYHLPRQNMSWVIGVSHRRECVNNLFAISGEQSLDLSY